MTFTGALASTLVIFLLAAPARGQDVISQEEPPPSSVDEIATPIDRSFLEKIPRPGVFPGNPSTKAGVPNENEFNADIQWRPKLSFLNGFSARYRYALVRQYQGPKDNQQDFRVIINYDFPLL